MHRVVSLKFLKFTGYRIAIARKAFFTRIAFSASHYVERFRFPDLLYKDSDRKIK